MFKNVLCCAAVCVAASTAAQAQEAILSFGFTELSGGYSTASTQFSAVGVDTASLRSTGDVTRLLGPSSTAQYLPGAAAGLVNVNLAVSGITPTTANGAGTLAIMDVNGDLLTANIAGQFSNMGTAVFFNGLLSDAQFVSVSGDGLFNGPSGGSFPLTFAPATAPYNGAIFELFVGTPGNFFTGDFSGVSVQVSGAVTPAPASLALLGLGAAFAARRRRA
jgi:MYXO-CTERM domain-containing protein